MGFDNECILNIQSLPGEYFCPVCRTLIYPNEALQTQCTHLYCKPCLAYVVATSHACPYDGYLVTEADSKPLTESNKSIAEAIGKVAVYCLYHRSGCQWQGTLTDCISHCTGCSFGNSPVLCNRCGAQIMHRQVQEHGQSCPGLQPQAQGDTAQAQASSGQMLVVAQDSSATASVPTATTTASTPTATAAGSTPVATTVASAASTATVISAASTAAVASAASTTAVALTSNTVAAAAAPYSGQGSTQSNPVVNQQAATQAPTAEQWYQQQQLQYQQYYQQYPGYDPYQQQYQPYGQYQQQAYQQYPQAYMQVPTQPAVQGQQLPVQYMQPQSQPRPQVQPQPQSQTLLQPQPQTQVQAAQVQLQPQVQPAPLPAQQLPFPQSQPQPQPQSQHQIQPQTQHHTPAQYPLVQAQPPQAHPPPYAQMPGPPPHAQPLPLPMQTLPPHHPAMTAQAHPHSHVQHTQPPPQIHPQAQPQQLPMQPQPHPQSHPRPLSQPIPQSQTQHAAQAVTGHQSYPQPPFHQVPPGAPQQRPIHMYPQQQLMAQHTAQHPPQQTPQMRPSPNLFPGQAPQQQGMLPPPDLRTSAVPPHQQAPLAGQQPGQQFHHPVGLQPVVQPQVLPHQHAHGQLYPSQQYQQGSPMPQHLLNPQQPLRPPGPPSQQQISAQPQLQQNAPVPHGLPTPQGQPVGVRPMMLNHGAPQQALQPSPNKEYSNSRSSELQGSSTPGKAAQMPKMEDETVPKNSEGKDSAEFNKIYKNESDPDDINAGADAEENSQTDRMDIQESARIGEAQIDNSDEQVVEHATNETANYQADDMKEVSKLNTAQEEKEINLQGGNLNEKPGGWGAGAARVEPLPNLEGSFGSSQSLPQGMNPDELSVMPPTGVFPAKGKYLDPTAYGCSLNIADHAMASQRPPAPDRAFPQFPPHVGPVHDRRLQEFPPHQAQLNAPPQGMQVYGPGMPNPASSIRPPGGAPIPKRNFEEPNLAPQTYSQANMPLPHGVDGRPPQGGPLTVPPVNGPPPTVFGAPGGMMGRGPPVVEEHGFQSRPSNVDGFSGKGPIGGMHDSAPARSLTEERFKTFPEEGFKMGQEDRFRPVQLDPHRRITNQGELEEDPKQFHKLTHFDVEGMPKFGGPFPSHSGGLPLLPTDIRERHKPIGAHDEWGRRPDAFGPNSGGYHHMDNLPPLRSPGRDYAGFASGRFGFGSQSNMDDFVGREPRNIGERSKAFNVHADSFGSSFHESRFPKPYPPGPTHFSGNAAEGPGHMRMMEQLGPRNLPGDMRNDLDGPDVLPRNLRGFGGLHHDGRMGEPTFPGNYPPHLCNRDTVGGGYLPGRTRIEEPGLVNSYSIHSFPNEGGRFGSISAFEDMDSFEHSRKRKPGNMGWCRICKIDCGSVEGLDTHSQTREHEKMTMDLVLSIKKEYSKKKKLASEDGAAVEDAKSRKASFETRGSRQ